MFEVEIISATWERVCFSLIAITAVAVFMVFLKRRRSQVSKPLAGHKGSAHCVVQIDDDDDDVGESKWSTLDLLYRIANHPEEASIFLIRSLAKQAFDTWSKVTNLRFEETVTVNQENIRITFEEENHSHRGEPCIFKGVLAHTYPPRDGTIHINKNFYGNDKTIASVRFVNTLVHEIGHSLGLPDTSSRRAIMYHTQLNEPFTEPQPEDIQAIQALYGTRSARFKLGVPEIVVGLIVLLVMAVLYGVLSMY